jgi:hypothetical protein
MRHELWAGETEQTFCLAGPHGDGARSQLPAGSVLVWTVNAACHFEAMTLYYEHVGWGVYSSDQAWDYVSYEDHGWE